MPATVHHSYPAGAHAHVTGSAGTTALQGGATMGSAAPQLLSAAPTAGARGTSGAVAGTVPGGQAPMGRAPQTRSATATSKPKRSLA